MSTDVILCVANCTSTWIRHDHIGAFGRLIQHRSDRIANVTQCQEACEFDHRCIAANWVIENSLGICRTILDSNYDRHVINGATLYELRSRCNISAGHCSSSTTLTVTLNTQCIYWQPLFHVI